MQYIEKKFLKDKEESGYTFDALRFTAKNSFDFSSLFFSSIFSRVLRDSTTRFVGPSVRRSVHHTLLFSAFCGLWPHCSCPND